MPGLHSLGNHGRERDTNFPVPKKISFCSQPVAVLHRRNAYSCRSFDGRGLPLEILAGLERFAPGLEWPFASRLRFGIIDNEKVRSENLFSAGSYGMIRGAALSDRPGGKRTSRVAGKTPGSPWRPLSCRRPPWAWAAAGSAAFSTASASAGPWTSAPESNLPAVVAVGRPAVRPTLRDRLVRWSAKGNLRKSPAALFLPKIGARRCPMKKRPGRRYWNACAWRPRLPTSSPGASSSRRRLSFLPEPRQGLQRHDAKGRPAAHRHGHRHVPFPAGGCRSRAERRMVGMGIQGAWYACQF